MGAGESAMREGRLRNSRKKVTDFYSLIFRHGGAFVGKPSLKYMGGSSVLFDYLNLERDVSMEKVKRCSADLGLKGEIRYFGVAKCKNPERAATEPPQEQVPEQSNSIGSRGRGRGTRGRGRRRSTRGRRTCSGSGSNLGAMALANEEMLSQANNGVPGPSPWEQLHMDTSTIVTTSQPTFPTNLHMGGDFRPMFSTQTRQAAAKKKLFITGKGKQQAK